MARAKTEAVNKLRQFLRNLELFEMLGDADLGRLMKLGRIEGFGTGDMIFDTGDRADRVHVILEGAIEIIRATPDSPTRIPVAYLSPGEIVGDMALLTGSRRRSGGRVPERLVVWTLTRSAFEKYASATPGYWRTVAKVFASRHEVFISHMRRQAGRKELSGKLEYFDLPTVVQTLVSANQTGVLVVNDEAGETFAQILLVDGAVDRARCGNLEGEDAFHEIFLAGIKGQFYFRSVSDPRPDSVSPNPIGATTINLLMEAVRRVDEFAAVQDRLPDPEKAYVTQTAEVSWEDDRTAKIARRIFDEMRTPKKLSALVGQTECSRFTLYEVASRLAETQQIA